MKRITFRLLLICILTACQSPLPEAGEGREMNLWPDNIELESNGYTLEQSDAIHSTMIVTPTLTVYLPEKPCGQAILCCPGGGYVDVWHGTEGHNYAPWLNAQGITLGVLKYRTPNGHSTIPLTDLQRAINLMREHAEDWHVQQLGVMGFSAGGHLVSTAATHWTTRKQRPDFQVLFYPVITMDSTFTHMGSRHYLLGDNPSEEAVRYYSNELHVNADTPEAFIVFSANDGLVPIRNSEAYCEALTRSGVACTLLRLPTGDHGWSGHPEFAFNGVWQSALSEWLKTIRK